MPKKRLILIVPILVIAAVIWWAERPRPQTLVLTGTVDGNEVVVGSKITGRIVRLAVDDGQSVKAGDLIAVLDQDELAADRGAATHAIAQARANAQQSVTQTELLAGSLPTKVHQAEAQVEQTQAQLEQAQAQVSQTQAQLRQAEAQVEQTQATVAKAQDNFNRIRPLVEKDINPPQDLVTANMQNLNLMELQSLSIGMGGYNGSYAGWGFAVAVSNQSLFAADARGYTLIEVAARFYQRASACICGRIS